jgi:hypothetical protein
MPEAKEKPKPSLPLKLNFDQPFQLSLAALKDDFTQTNGLWLSFADVQSLLDDEEDLGAQPLRVLHHRLGRRTYCLPTRESVSRDTTLKDYFSAAKS